MRAEHALFSGVEGAARRDGFTLDEAQRALLDRLAALGADVTRASLRKARPRGLYIHGEAGRGKSWLADAFFTQLPTAQKTRVHVHRFFDTLHRGIQAHRDDRDAIAQAVDDVTQGSRLLFFDELHVHDAGDARLMTRLLEHAFARDLTVLATSNYAPDELLPNPIWHHLFEPGIALITQHMDVWELRGPVDYRSVNERHERGFAAGRWLPSARADRTDGPPVRLTVEDRTFVVTDASDGRLVATFAQLCQAPVSTVEYLPWAQEFREWVVTGIPALGEVDAEAQQRFITLVDVLVDADVRTTFTSRLRLREFLADVAHRPDAFRMASRLQLLDEKSAGDHTAPGGSTNRV